MMNLNEQIGLNIRTLREHKGWSQEKLAAVAGMHRNYIGQIERGEKNITIRNLARIAEALGISLSKLLDISEVDFE